MLDRFYSGCMKDSFLLVDSHGLIEHPLFLEEYVTLILPRAFHNTAKSSLGQPGHALALTLTPRDPSSPTGPSGPLAPWKKAKERQKIRTKSIYLTGKYSSHPSFDHQGSPRDQTWLSQPIPGWVEHSTSQPRTQKILSVFCCFISHHYQHTAPKYFLLLLNQLPTTDQSQRRRADQEQPYFRHQLHDNSFVMHRLAVLAL